MGSDMRTRHLPLQRFSTGFFNIDQHPVMAGSLVRAIVIHLI